MNRTRGAGYVSAAFEPEQTAAQRVAVLGMRVAVDTTTRARLLCT